VNCNLARKDTTNYFYAGSEKRVHPEREEPVFARQRVYLFAARTKKTIPNSRMTRLSTRKHATIKRKGGPLVKENKKLLQGGVERIKNGDERRSKLRG